MAPKVYVVEPSLVEPANEKPAIEGLSLGLTVGVEGGSIKGAEAMARSGVLEAIRSKVTNGALEETMEGAPMVTLEVTDPLYKISQTGVFDYGVEVTLDDVDFHLVHIEIHEDETLSLVCEHSIVTALRQHTTPIKASRGEVTRAQFIYRMLREIPDTFQFVSPELTKRQRLAKIADTPAAKKARSKPGTGFPKSARGKLTIKGVTADGAQLRNLAIALAVAERERASARATLSMVCSGIGESGWRSIMNGAGSPYGGVLQGNVGGGVWKLDDVEGMATSFLRGGKGFQGGGAIHLARKYPTWTPGYIAFTVEGDLANFHGNTAKAAQFYDMHRREAEAIIAAYTGDAGLLAQATGTGAGSSYWKKYEFSRGVPGSPHEDSWTAGLRLAAEVHWRLFIVGRQTVYYVSDADLSHGDMHPESTISRATPGFVKLDANVEVGGRYVVQHGRKRARPSEATLTLRVGRWEARPGSLLDLDPEFGPASGKWLIHSIRRGLFDAETEVNLRRPENVLPEPRAELGIRSKAAKRVSGGNANGVATGGGRAVDARGIHATAGESAHLVLWTAGGSHVWICEWLVPQLNYALGNGWDGHITEGWRSYDTEKVYWDRYGHDPGLAAPPGQSNHGYATFPRGAIDTPSYTSLAAALRSYRGPHRLVGAGAVLPRDPVHFSLKGN